MTDPDEAKREMAGMTHPSFQIEAGATAKYHQVADWFANRILSGELRPGERLPSDRRLAKQLNLSPTTTTAAMNDLLHRRFVIRRHGSGTFVANDPQGLNRRFRIGFISPVTISGYTRQILTSLWACCGENRCDLLPIFRNVDEIESSVAEYAFDGVLIYNRNNISIEMVKRLRARGIPAILLSSVQEESSDFCIGYSNERIMADAVKYLTGLGHRQIGFVIDRRETFPNNVRCNSFMASMWEAQLPVNPAWMLTSEVTPETLAAYLSSPDRPSSLIVGNRTLAVRIIQAVNALNISVPAGLSILCIDEPDDAWQLWPQLSRLRINVEDFTRQGILSLLQLIRHENPEKTESRNYEFVEAGSCAPPASR